MYFIAILIVLLVIGYLVSLQLDGTPPGATENTEQTGVEAPRVPARPQDVPGFGRQMDAFMNEAAADRAKRIEAGEQ